MELETSEGLPYITGLTYYSRMRLITNLLPLIRQAPSLRRVVSTFAGTKDGRIYANDIAGRKVPLRGARGHLSGVMTFALEALSKQAPEVSFVHNFPGAIKTDLIRKESGRILQTLWFLSSTFMSHSWMDNGECGERHAFLCLGAEFPPATGGDGRNDGSKVEVVKGTDGKVGSGAYDVDEFGECASESVLEVLKKQRDEGVREKIWKHTEGEFVRVTGTVSI